MTRPDLNQGVIGNCAFGALVDPRGRIGWACLPRFDGDPVFHSLLAGPAPGAGFFDVTIEGWAMGAQSYEDNTAILTTRQTAADGGAIEITDFAPRFKQKGRTFRPTTILRRIAPIAGSPRVRVRLRPRFDWGTVAPQITKGSNHVRYVGPDQTLRLYSTAPPSYLLEERAFAVDRPFWILLGADESVAEGVDALGERFLAETRSYWRDWTRSLSIPFEWQDAVIRAAITLKLLSFEETGAVIAAMTTSIPEAADSGRCWDYRYCWLRDSFFTVHALNRLGATRTMEDYIDYIVNVAAERADGYLQPLFGVAREMNIDEWIVETLPGYRGMGPVRVGNAAYGQVQNDGYGAVILSAAQAFFDRRLERPGDHALFWRLERLGEQARARFDQPDAGLWEYRGREAAHTFSAAMCWAACDRLAKIAARLDLPDRARAWRADADRIAEKTLRDAWSNEAQAFVDVLGGGDNLDASALLLPQLGLIAADDPRYAKTVAAIEKKLLRDGRLHRYHAQDDFGAPETAFTICSFWYVEALAALGRRHEARALFESLLASRNAVGLLSEDIDVATGELWGNFPQTYSMVGLISAAMRLSQHWEDAF